LTLPFQLANLKAKMTLTLACTPLPRQAAKFLLSAPCGRSAREGAGEEPAADAGFAPPSRAAQLSEREKMVTTVVSSDRARAQPVWKKKRR
jgi:hypothetical protein